MKKIIFTAISCAFSIISYGQTFRNAFDNYESGAGGAFGQGLSYHINIKHQGAYLLLSEGIYMESYLMMFKATKDKRYLDKFIIHSKRVQERRDDNVQYNIPVPIGTSCSNLSAIPNIPSSKGWSVDIDGDKCNGWLQRVLHSAALTYPMAEFVYFMQTDPDFMNVANEFVPAEAQGFYPNINPYYNIQTYSDYAVWLKNRVNETIQ